MSTQKQTHPASRIQILPSDVIDQIAAGEVVERPAHLVKELVENAIDAGATAIEIEYDQGGRRVRVTDNGSGISPEDLPRAIARHGTSKIQTADDLFSLSSFGFRGEALASIGSVSRLSIQSRTADAKTSTKLVCEYGRVAPPEVTGGNVGTTVSVEELFTNIPARLKFLKSEAGETAQIKATLKALALANENVEFRLRTKGKVEDVWPAQKTFLERAQTLTPNAKLYSAAGGYEDAEAEIAFASPHDVSGNARGIQIFVQGRWVQDKSLQAAVIDAYRGLLMHGEYPIAIVRLRVPASDVDVNIHPTKSQVKFRDSQMVFRAVNRTLRAALEQAPWLAKDQQVAVQEKMARARSYGGESASEASAPTQKLSVAELTRPYESASIGRFDSPDLDTIQFKQKSDWVPQASQPPTTQVLGTDEDVTPGAWSRLQVLGQADLTYIIAQDDTRLVLIDQHAAHERVAYEKLMKAWLGGQADSQPLLLPLTVELEPDGAEALMSIAGELQKLGLEIDQIGPQSVAVRSLPPLIKPASLLKALGELANEIVEKGGSFALEKKISDLCATMACHSVVRAGQALSTDQMRSLLKQLDQFPLSSFCPHGRPVSVDYPFAKLERDFGRIP